MRAVIKGVFSRVYKHFSVSTGNFPAYLSPVWPKSRDGWKPINKLTADDGRAILNAAIAHSRSSEALKGCMASALKALDVKECSIPDSAHTLLTRCRQPPNLSLQ